MVDNLSIAVHAFPMNQLSSLSEDDIYNWAIWKRPANFKYLSYKVEMAQSSLHHLNSIVSMFP